ncbi:unnamed protein product [Schistosoma mattheei]|uniref:Uncharacterized protein n=1 Tax=Schistosoma mattheei TaxID=31246 RepID=A0A183PFI7_9TREM|nr:unnamed protein product [Schistosoma mattheei]
MNSCWGLFGLALRISLYKRPSGLLKGFSYVDRVSTQKLLPMHLINLQKHTRCRHVGQDSDSSDDELADEDEDDDDNADELDPYYSEDMAFSPHFRQISSYVKSLRFDKIIRVGLDITRSAADNAFFSNRCRLNGGKLLKMGTTVYIGDKLDIVIDDTEEPLGKRVRVLDIKQSKQNNYKISLRCWRNNLYYVKLFLVGRPPLALFSLFILLCAVGLIVLDVLVNKSPPNNPDVEKHWNKLLLELSGLEFCIINSSNARLMSESYASAHVLRGLDDMESDNVIISHAIHLPLLIYPNEEFVYDMSYLLIAKMHGRHIGIKGMLQFSYQLQRILFYTEHGSMGNIVILLKQSWSVET